jgi:hypothetical protein
MLDKGQTPLPDVTAQKIHTFLAIIGYMDQKDMPKNYWSTLK